MTGRIASTHGGESCGGVNIMITDHEDFEPVSTGLAIAATIRQAYPDDWQHKRYLRLLGNDAVMEQLNQQADWDTLVAKSKRGVDAFMERRAKYLLYQ